MDAAENQSSFLDVVCNMIEGAVEDEAAARKRFIKWFGKLLEGEGSTEWDLVHELEPATLLIECGITPHHPWNDAILEAFPEVEWDESWNLPREDISPSEDVSLREQIHDFAISELANPWHRECMGRLFEDWHERNELHFESALTLPLILLAEPSTPNAFGSCGNVSAFGGREQIRIRPSLLRGTHPIFDRDNSDNVTREGRFEFVRDVLLHEMIHQWQHTTGRSEPTYHGHGPHFRDKANELGEKLGLPRVRTCKRRGKDADLPSCSQWPHNVRPGGYYAPAGPRVLR